MLRTGQMLGPYQIETLLGRGAMGVVYRGVDERNGAAVAIKTIRTDLLAGAEQEAILARFQQEAQIGMRLRHPLVVGVRDFGEEFDLLYLVMDFVAGQELGHLLEQQPNLPLGMSLAIILQLLNALAYAHGQGVVHRDIKPANILVRANYTVALTDFGIAHVSGSELTQLGDLLGSPLYMAPEQLRGEAVDARADLFSVGVVLYYLLTRRKPFEAPSLAVLMHRVLHEEPPLPSTLSAVLPATFDAVVQRALAKDRGRRFGSALEFAATLRQARTVEAQTAGADATVVMPGGFRYRLPPATLAAATAGTQVAATTLETLAEQIVALVQGCLHDRATGQRLAQLRDHLADWFALAARLPQAPETVQQSLRYVCTGEPLTALVELIQRNAPLPGRTLPEGRGDWLELIRLFGQLREAAGRLHAEAQLAPVNARLIRELTGAVLNYAGPLNRLLFSGDDPQLSRIAADFMRIEVLQLALEELGAMTEVSGVQQTLLLFAGQVMSKVNAMIRQFLDSRDPLARFGVANLLVEIEELINLADRLLENGAAAAAVEGADSGSVIMAEFIANARELARLIGAELRNQVHADAAGAFVAGLDSKLMPVSSNSEAVLFSGRLRQLGLLYRFANRLEASGHSALLRGLVSEVYDLLQGLTETLLENLRTWTGGAGNEQATERLGIRLSLIAELAEQFGWPELQQQILLEVRSRLVAV